VELRRADLFAVPVWRCRLDDVPDADEGEMARAADDHIAREPAHGAPFAQSDVTLTRHPSPALRAYFAWIGARFEELVRTDLTYRRPIRRAYVESSAMRIDQLTEFSRLVGLESLHAHLPALVTSVLYLRVPSTLEGAPHGGVVLRDPASVATNVFGRARHHEPAEQGKLFVFPGYVEHRTDGAPPDVPWDRPRTVIVTDLLVDG